MMDGEIFTIRARKFLRCGRLLTSSEAIEKGYGCQCALKAKAEEREREPVPGQMDIFSYINESEEKTDEPENKD